MSFLFANDEFSFKCRYLGCVPLAQSTEEAASQAVDLLFHKLDSIQVSVRFLVPLQSRFHFHHSPSVVML